MIEAGKIDWSCHNNDAATSIYEALALDEAVKVAYDFARKDKNTIVIVTGDHETGGMNVGFRGINFDSLKDVLRQQKISYDKFTTELIPKFRRAYRSRKNLKYDDFKPLITDSFGLNFTGNSKMSLTKPEKKQLQAAFKRAFRLKKVKKPFDADYDYGRYNPLTVSLTHILNRKSGITWNSYYHTALPVITSVFGKGSEIFNGVYDNTDIALKIKALMGCEPVVEYFE